MPQRLQQWERADTITVVFTMAIGVVWALLGLGLASRVDGFSASLPVLLKLLHVFLFLPLYVAYVELAILEHLTVLEQPVGIGPGFALIVMNGALMGLLPGLLLVWRMR